MDEKKLFLTADNALSAVVEQIKDDQWDMVMPKTFRTWSNPDKDLTLREVINYHAYDEAWVPETLAGKTIEEVGDKYKVDLLGHDPKAGYMTIVRKAQKAVDELTDLDRKVHLTYGEFPVREYLQHISYFRGLRVYDIAKIIGADTKMPEDLVLMLWDLLKDNAEQWRAMGVLGTKIDVPEDAPLQDRLLGLTGRQP